MSGDVQPRKRKDKKKKRDGFDRKSEGELSFSRHSSFEDDESSHGVHITKMGSEDVHFHVQHEHGTGGHWCAKIFFFSLLAILFGLVGLIILEHRGISDLDTPLSESRFSNYFDGWVDESRQEHDDHDPVQASIEEHDEHDEPFEEEEDHSELDEDADEKHDEEDDDDDEHDVEEEDATTEQTKEEEEDEDNDEKDEDNDNDDEDDEEDTTAEATVEQSNEEEDNEDDNDVDNDNTNNEDDDDDEDENVTQEVTKEEEENDEADDNDEENKDEKTAEFSQEANDDDDNDNDNEVDENNSNADAADNDDDDDADNDDDDNSVEPIYERSTQQTSQLSTGNSAAAVDDDDDAFDEEDDDDDVTNDSVENVVDNDAEELLLLQQKARQQAAEAAKNAPNSAEKDDKDDSAEAVPSWASSLAVKIGVGVALALVARLVLIRNNPNTIEEPAPEVIMKRRLTIATAEDTYDNDEEEPPLPDDGEYSEEEIEIEEEYEYEEDEEIELPEDPDDNLSALAGEYIPETFEQLNSLYRSRLSEPESAHTSSIPEHVEKVREQRFVAKKSPAVFTAPPPPATTTDISFKKVSPFTTTATTTRTAQTFTPNLGQTQSQTTTSTKDETIKPQQNFNTTTTKTTTAADLYSPKSNTKQYIPDSPKTTKAEVTHDLDYQPDEEDIDYDDDDGVDNDGVGDAYTRDILEDTDEEDEEEEEDEEDIDDDLLDDEDISDVDDTELMNRLEAKYGRLPAKEYESDEDPDDPTWTQIKPKEELGGGPQAQNDDFGSFEHELRRANEDIMRENYALADKRFAELVQRFPDRPEVFLAQARLLDKLSEQQRSNSVLNQAIQAYKRYLALGEFITDHEQFRKAAERCIERIRFMGHHMQAVPIHQQLIARFTNKPDVMNQLAITYLLQNRLSDAKLVLQEVLRRWPKDGFAQVHYGFVLRQLDKDYENAVIYLREGIKSKAPGTQDGRFYFNLGDSLQRLGRQAEAVEVYKRAAALKLFPSVYQRSLYNEPDLRAKPYWTKEETTYVKYLNKLELNWQAIRDEALSLLSRRGNYLDEAESLRDTGNWQQFELYSRGQRRVKNCQKAPITCGLIEKFTAAAGCRRGQVKFSIMQPGTHVHAHCGPTNCRLRAHLGLVVPKGPRLRVAEEERTWKEGEFLIFDDSFEHEVWHNGTSLRLVLIVDVWHPDLSAMKRRTLSPI
nr:aspartyl/asparaginyl beta-hydroxylase isoform X2 [Bactrocera oleae]